MPRVKETKINKEMAVVHLDWNELKHAIRDKALPFTNMKDPTEFKIEITRSKEGSPSYEINQWTCLIEFTKDLEIKSDGSQA